jgi:hypothetical protein
VVLVVLDPAEISAEDLLALFWENHDPTQGRWRDTAPVINIGRASSTRTAFNIKPLSPLNCFTNAP